MSPCGKRAALALALSCFSCAARDVRTLTPPGQQLDHSSPYLKAHLKDGRVYVLSNWRVDEAAQVVHGTGQLLGAERDLLASGELTFSISDVALFETNRTENSPSVAALAIITAASVGMTVFCIASTKTCFGSCPTFYAWDGERESLMAEGFSGAIAPSLEETDLDALFRARPVSRDFTLRMTNEALETHVVRRVALLAARRPLGGRVLATPGGELWQAQRLIEPASCAAREGDCLPAVRALDGVERFSATDGEDLATREEIELAFADPGGRRLGLALGFRQGFISTFLFYQTLAYMGRSAGADFVELERGDESVRKAATAFGRALGGIEVLAYDGKGFVRAGEAHEIGPIATDVQLVPLPLLPKGPVRLKLRLARGNWRLDLAALAVLGEKTEPLRLEAISIERRGKDVSQAAPIVTGPGDQVVYRFRLQEDFAAQELFLESRGYYLEWMRDEWLGEESKLSLYQILFQPERALRSLAPAYKELEPRFEAAFWGSRYAGN